MAFPIAAVMVIAALVVAVRWAAPHRRAGGIGVVVLEALRQVSGPERGAWIDAMVAESFMIDDPRERRRFTRGCARAALAAPAGPDSTPLVPRAAVGLSVAAAAGLAAFGLVHYPGLRQGPAWIAYVSVFVVGLLLYLVAGAQTAKWGTTSSHRAGVVAAAPAVACAWYAASSNGAATFAVAMVCVLLPGLAAVWSVRRHGTAGAGIAAAAVGALITGLLFFVGYVTTTYARGSGTPTGVVLSEFTRSGMHNFRAWSIGDNLGGACFMLLFVPLLGTAVGLLAVRITAKPHTK
jgi:hypothetical protein